MRLTVDLQLSDDARAIIMLALVAFMIVAFLVWCAWLEWSERRRK